LWSAVLKDLLKETPSVAVSADPMVEVNAENKDFKSFLSKHF